MHAYSGFTNETTYAFIAHTENDRDTYEFLRDYATEMRRHVPSMTPQTLGHNIKLTCRTIVANALAGEQPRVYGWADDLKVPWVTVRLLLHLDGSHGLEHINENDLGESWLETIAA